VVVPLLPVLALGHPVAVTVDSGQDLQERDVLPGAEKLREGLGIALLLGRRAEREASLPEFDKAVCPVGNMGVGGFVLSVEASSRSSAKKPAHLYGSPPPSS